MTRIVMQSVPHLLQRYPTVGDWFHDATTGTDTFVVSAMDDPRYELLVLVHELVEWSLCRERGISQADVDQFDQAYERTRPSTDTTSEPGDHPLAPYRREHRFAENLERQLAHELGVDWSAYTAAVEALP